MLNWANHFSIYCFMDSHNYKDDLQEYDCLLAVGAKEIFCPTENIISSLKEFCSKKNKWLFGHVNYDVKSETEHVISNKTNRIGFPLAFFFVPEIIIRLAGNKIIVTSFIALHPTEIFKNIIESNSSEKNIFNHPPKIKSIYSREEYIEIINKLKAHIKRGDCYEINFCIEFFADKTSINATEVYKKLVEISPTPFSCFYKLNNQYLLCASPERYIKKKGDKLISQPIKGTASRHLSDLKKDAALKKELYESQKNRSENVMVVDLVRNDLSRICKQGTVQVDELFAVYSFAQVHQMISTVSGIVDEEINFADVLAATFPMGSMTGAPKRKVVQLIDEYEKTSRGIFSGTVGYISPENNFDFNVIIRSIMYNETQKTISYFAGSGITFYSEAANEYEECLLKTKAMVAALQV